MSSQSSRTGVIIEAGGQHQRYFGDVWALRHLLWMFAWREIVLRYKQTTVGILWVVLRPLLTVAIFAVVFGRFLRVPSGDLHYPLLILSGFIPWQFVAYSFAGASESLFTHSSVISKVYFPRIIAPISVFLVNVVDLAVALLLLAILMGVYGVTPDRRLFALPLFLLFAVPGAAGLALWFAAVSAKYRDFRNVIPFVVMLTLYVSPVAFSAAVVPAEWKFWYWLNPLVAAIEGMRWSLFSGRGELYWPGMLASLMLSLAVLVLGYRYFRSVERSIVDVI